MSSFIIIFFLIIGTLFVAIEYVALGDLRDYLRTTRESGHVLTSSRLLTFAFDVAKGMDHLSKQGV